MQSLAYIPGSTGSANASLMTVSQVRTAPAATITVNTVAGVPTKFYGTMGTPHTFTDPVTGEIITIVSEASAVDAAFTVNAGKIDIVAVAPGYTDAGSKVGDVIIVRPITEWANNIFNVLSAAHNDDGSLKTTSLDAFYKPSEQIYDYVVPGTGVWAGLGYGSTLTASMTALTCYIGGLRNTVPAVATRTFTASKDTYVDVLFSSTGVGTLVYTEVANNAASPALAANSVRLAIIVTGATNIANVGSVNQGEESKVLPLAAGIAYTVTDSLGNLICPRDPNRKILGYKQITAGVTAGTTISQVAGLSCPVIVPLGRKVKVTAYSRNLINGATAANTLSIWDGVVGSGTQISDSPPTTLNNGQPAYASIPVTPSAANKTYNAGLIAGSGTVTLSAATISPAYILVELA